jgi:hypothetical protein
MRPFRYTLLFAAALALQAPSASAQNALTAGPTLSTPVESPEHSGGVSITQNSSLTIDGGGVACANSGGGYTVENTYWRVFPLADFPAITEFFSVESVDIGIFPTANFSATGLDTHVRLYQMEGGVDFTQTFTMSNVTLVSEVTHHVNPTDPPALYNVVIPDSPDFESDDTLAVAWHTPDGSTTTPVTDIRYGYNDDGSIGTTYLQAAGCGTANPTDVALLGAFGTLQWVVQVNGSLTPVAAEPGGALPAAVTLGRVVPNPMASTATVTFTVHEPVEVRLAVYDVLGREVAVLAEGAYAVGTHTATFDGADAAGGTYLYRLEAAGAVQALTTTVLK